METATNLKRRRSSGEGAAKKVCSGPPCPENPLEGPSNAFPQKPPPQQAPLHLPFLPPLLSLPPPLLPLPPLAPLTLPPLPPSPQYHTPPEKQRSQPSQSPELLHHPPQPQKTRPHQILHMARSQSQERLSPKNLMRTFSLPSLSPSSSLELFPAATPAATPIAKPAEKEPVTEPVRADSAPRQSQWKAKATNQDLTEEQCRKAVALCTVGLESVADHQLRKSLKPLLNLEKVNGKKVCNLSNFRGAPMMTTFICSAGDRSKGVWKFLDMVCQTDTGVELTELEHPSLKRCLPYCTGRVPILVHPSLYRSLKVRFPMDVGRVSRNFRMTTELGSGSLRQAVGILTPGDFRPIVDTD